MYLVLGRRERLFLLGDFNARVGRSAQLDDVKLSECING